MTGFATARLVDLGLLRPGEDARVDLLAGGYTNTVWRVRSGALDVVVKRYREAPAGLFANSAALEARALALLGPAGLAPRLVAHVADEATVVYEHVSGTPWDADPGIVARLLAAVHVHDGSGFPTLATTADALLREADAFAGRCSPALAARLAVVRPLPAATPLAPLRLVHRDCGPGNVIVASNRAVLIDWQCPGRGDPVEDLCAFLSPAFQILYGRVPLSPDDEHAFLDAYPDEEAVDRLAVVRRFYDHRMLGYCAWRSEALAADRPTDAATYERAVEALLA